MPRSGHQQGVFTYTLTTSTNTGSLSQKQLTLLDAYAHWMVYAQHYKTENPFLAYTVWKGQFVDTLRKNKSWYETLLEKAFQQHQSLVSPPPEKTIIATLFAPCETTDGTEQIVELQRRVTLLTQHHGSVYSVDRLDYHAEWANAFYIQTASYPFYLADISCALTLALAKDYGILIHTTHPTTAVFAGKAIQRQFIPVQVDPLGTQVALVPIYYEVIDEATIADTDNLLRAWAQWQMLSTTMSDPMSHFSIWCKKLPDSDPHYTWLCSLSTYSTHASQVTQERTTSPQTSTLPNPTVLLEQYLLPELARMGYPLPPDLDSSNVASCLQTCNQLTLGRSFSTADEEHDAIDDLGPSNPTAQQLDTLLDTMHHTRKLVSSLIDFHSQMTPQAAKTLPAFFKPQISRHPTALPPTDHELEDRGPAPPKGAPSS